MPSVTSDRTPTRLDSDPLDHLLSQHFNARSDPSVEHELRRLRCLVLLADAGEQVFLPGGRAGL